MRSRLQHLLAVASAALLLALQLCLIGPFELFSANRAEFDVDFVEVLDTLVPAFLLLFVCLFLPGALMPPRARGFYRTALFVLAAVIWIQGSFLRWDYGLLDGRGIDWSRAGAGGWVDAIVWLALLFLGFRFRRQVGRAAGFVAFTLALLLLVAAGVRVVRDPGLLEAEGELSGKSIEPEVAEISSQKNCFHLVLDAFQTDVFLELADEMGLQERLTGFTVFEENLSVSGKTSLSVPTMFSGIVYDGKQPVDRFFADSVRQTGLPGQLMQKGYVVNLMPFISMKGSRYTHHQTIPMTFARSPAPRARSLAAYLLDISLFRHSPHVLKPLIYNDDNWRLTRLSPEPANQVAFRHKAFFREYTSLLRPAYEEPGYHFLHLYPPHPPFVTRKDGSYAGESLPNTRENYKNQARAVLNLLLEMLERLKALGLYDSSAILVQGDHGTSLPIRRDGREIKLPVERAAALLAVKPPGQQGPLRRSLAPTSLADTPKTICEMLGVDLVYPGESVFELPQHDLHRPRRFVYTTSDAGDASSVTYLIRGSMYDPAAWSVEAAVSLKEQVAGYQWGQQIAFGVRGNGERYTGKGWAVPTSPTLQWNNGKQAVFRFKAPPAPEGEVEFNFTVFPFVVQGKLEKQRVQVTLGNRAVYRAHAQSKEPVIIKFKLNARDIPETVVLNFDFPDAVAPSKIGEGGDLRELAFALYEFIARPVEP